MSSPFLKSGFVSAKEALWGQQTQKALDYFSIGDDFFPRAFYASFGLQKRLCAQINKKQDRLSESQANAIIKAAQEVEEGLWDAHFPLSIWQTGSGTQTHMNVNEVIAARATQLSPETDGIHPNDHVNCGQSTNDSFPTVMHITLVRILHTSFFPALSSLLHSLRAKETAFASMKKVGRTHLQDATMMTVGQEFSAFAHQIDLNQKRLLACLPDLYAVAQGGTAVGTGINADPSFAPLFAEALAEATGYPFVSAPNKFEALASHDGCVALSGALNTLAGSLVKIGNDIRLLGSGPRCGLGELELPQNEPGSSIMPGKVNPTQIEALVMVCAHVMGGHSTVSFAGSQGHFQLNTFKPVIFYTLYKMISLLSQSMDRLTRFCVEGLSVVEKKLADNMERSLMHVTALTPHIGYDRAKRIAEKAAREDVSLRQAAIDRGYLTGKDFDHLMTLSLKP